MYKIIAFSGSHGVGKTSLIKKITSLLASNPNNQSKYKIFNEFNTGLYNMGFSLNGVGTDIDEVVFSQLQAFNLGYNTIKYYLSKSSEDRLIIMDRSCIDTYLYTTYFLQQANKENNYLHITNNMLDKCKEIESLIFTYLVPPFSNFDKTEIRMTLEERNKIWDMFKVYFANKTDNKMLNGVSTADRYSEFSNFISSDEQHSSSWLKLFRFA